MTVRPSDGPRTFVSRRARRLGGIALTFPAFLIAGLLMLPSAVVAGESPGFESATGLVPPGGTITTLDGPLDSSDPFAVSLKNISDNDLVVTIEEEPCDGSQVEDPLCDEPRVGGVAGDFIFEPAGPSESETVTVTTTTSNPAVVVTKLYYDVSLLEDVEGTRMFWQKTPGGPVLRLPRCDDDQRVECFTKTTKRNGDQIIRVKLRQDPRITRG
jgi:hypothetical protein